MLTSAEANKTKLCMFHLLFLVNICEESSAQAQLAALTAEFARYLDLHHL